MTTERPVRILNVNDREIPRYVTEETLRREGFEVVSVATGRDALAAATGDIALAILDVKLPDLDGYEVCRLLKGDPATAGVVVLLTSATFVTTQHKVTGLDSGADGYIVQPYEGPELIATVRSLLRTRAAERRASALAKELGAAMAVRDEFLAMLGHELRNPIGAISTAIHLLDGHRDGESVARYLVVLERQTRILTRLVDDLLDVARITRGKVSIEQVPVELREVVDRCVASLGDDAAQPVPVAIAISGGAPRVRGDAVRLEQIVCNLLTNALKYTPAGGHVAIRLAEVDGMARLEVEDDGIGMDAATCQRVFDLFVQGKQGLDRSRGGLGLGLTVVRQLVELHGGTITAASPGEGQGSTFTVTLPLADEVAAAAPAPPAAARASRALHLAVIEDNDDAREALADALTTSGHRVETAADGGAGLALVLASQPDAVLLDIGLPVCDGYTVAREIRARMNGHTPKLIAMTGYGQAEDRQRAFDAGFDVHLVKPLSMRQINAVLAQVRPRH